LISVTFSEQIQEKQISFAYSTTEDSFDRAVFRSTSQETLLDNEAISKGLESIDFSFDEPNLDESDEPIKEVSGKELSSDPPSSLFDFPNQNEKSESIEQKSPERKEFSWDAITTPKTNQDPFVDDETVKASKVKQFVIKSPFSNGFSNSIDD
jgi:hypothetical protein